MIVESDVLGQEYPEGQTVQFVEPEVEYVPVKQGIGAEFIISSTFNQILSYRYLYGDTHIPLDRPRIFPTEKEENSFQGSTGGKIWSISYCKSRQCTLQVLMYYRDIQSLPDIQCTTQSLVWCCRSLKHKACNRITTVGSSWRCTSRWGKGLGHCSRPDKHTQDDTDRTLRLCNY